MSRVIKSTVAGFVLLTGWGLALSAQVILIPEDRPTIQEGIDAASDGDTILIEENTYFENINFRGKAITVASRYLVDGDTSHISKTIIDGSRPANPDTASVVTLWSGEDTTSILCGLTIRGGSGTLVDSIHGPALAIMSAAKYVAGGGILIYNSGGKIVNNVIINNRIEGIIEGVRGGLGAGISASVNHGHQAVIRNNIISGNAMDQRNGHGGGIGLHGGPFLVEHNQIRNNQIDVLGMAAGGGIMFEFEGVEGSVPEVLIRNNVISDNILTTIYDGGGGGGIAVLNTLGWGNVMIFNNLIAGNVADIGGGIYGWNSSTYLQGNMLLRNRALMRDNDVGSEAENSFDVNNNLYCPERYWITGCNGIHEFKAGNPVPGRFDPGTGILVTPFSSHFSLESATGMIHIGDRPGMITFDALDVPLNLFVYNTLFIDLETCEDSMGKRSGDGAKSSNIIRFKLDIPVELYSIYFRSATFTGDANQLPDRIFRFFLKERDPDTLTANKSFEEGFANFKPRRYHFWASQQDTLRKQEPVELLMTIKVHAPWYRAWWAILSYILFLGLAVTLFVRIRTRRLMREKMALEEEVKKRTAELRQKNEHILEMERLKTRFFTDVSHEIRTPLTLITGPLDKLTRMDHPDPRTREWLTVILRNSQRLLQLVNQLLDISRLESGEMKLILVNRDLISQLRILVSQYSSMAESKQIRFVVDIPEGEMVTWHDREKITKIGSNLLSNAFKFTPPGGIVTFRVRVRSGKIKGEPLRMRLIVSDTGTGIPVEEREKIFSRFYRSQRFTATDAGGTGIGLSLTRELARLMHGEVSVRSIEGKGSVFIAEFPLGKDHLGELEYILKKPDPAESAGSEHHFIEGVYREVEALPDQERDEVLVVEDNSDLRKFIRESLSVYFMVSEAVHGKEGWEVALSRLPDLVITDVMMPEMTGMELCEKLKGDERTSHIPVIMLTAKSAPDDRKDGLVREADDYITKPFEMEALIIRIRNLLEQRKKLRKKYSAMIHMDWSSLRVTTLDEQFLKKLTGFVADHIDDFDLSVNMLKDEMAMSREHLFRKLKALTGDSPTGLIRNMRMNAAAAMLEKSEENITRIALNTGYSSHSYFTKTFRKFFGMSPQEYRRGHRKHSR